MTIISLIVLKKYFKPIANVKKNVMTIISLIVLKEMFEINCKCQGKCHMKKKRKSHTSPGSWTAVAVSSSTAMLLG